MTRALRSAAAKDRLERGGGRREEKRVDRERKGKDKRSDTSDLSGKLNSQPKKKTLTLPPKAGRSRAERKG